MAYEAELPADLAAGLVEVQGADPGDALEADPGAGGAEGTPGDPPASKVAA